jgi:hypothetical protein
LRISKVAKGNASRPGSAYRSCRLYTPSTNRINGEGTEMAEINDPLTREEVMQVLNKAADLVIEEIGRGGDATPEQDAINLLVNVFGAMLDNPDTTVDEVMDANYAGDGESGAEMVRSWWGWERPA